MRSRTSSAPGRERMLARGHLVQHHAKRPDVVGFVGGATGQHRGRQVPHGTAQAGGIDRQVCPEQSRERERADRRGLEEEEHAQQPGPAVATPRQQEQARGGRVSRHHRQQVEKNVAVLTLEGAPPPPAHRQERRHLERGEGDERLAPSLATCSERKRPTPHRGRRRRTRRRRTRRRPQTMEVEELAERMPYGSVRATSSAGSPRALMAIAMYCLPPAV